MSYPPCPSCGSHIIVRNGHTGAGKPRFACTECGRQFVEDPQVQRVSEQQKAKIDRMLEGDLLLVDIADFAGVSNRWLQNYVNAKYADVPREQRRRAKKSAV